MFYTFSRRVPSTYLICSICFIRNLAMLAAFVSFFCNTKRVLSLDLTASSLIFFVKQNKHRSHGRYNNSIAQHVYIENGITLFFFEVFIEVHTVMFWGVYAGKYFTISFIFTLTKFGRTSWCRWVYCILKKWLIISIVRQYSEQIASASVETRLFKVLFLA